MIDDVVQTYVFILKTNAPAYEINFSPVVVSSDSHDFR